MPSRPYKFLDFYTDDDAEVFAGRRRETDILLTDILSSKLVVLYARTGSGKSSLINAGVRPHLARLDYASVVVRVERDPVQSARRALLDANLLHRVGEASGFGELMREAVRAADSPLVVFLDQFEEFFIYLKEPAQRAFVADLADMYSDDTLPVHVVLAMREEFFYQLDIFRDRIPRIFHKESNLRLLPFDAAAAREVIQRPAARFGVTVAPDVITAIIDELSIDERVEPARLQIVLDTLWNTRSGSEITIEQFQSMGRAEGILRSRLSRDLDAKLSDAAIQALEAIVVELSSDEGTKKIRAVEELRPHAAEETLEELMRGLVDLRLVRESIRDRVRYVEWTSDYLAEHGAELREDVHRLSLNRLASRLDTGILITRNEFHRLVRDVSFAPPMTQTAAGRYFELALLYGVGAVDGYRRAASANAPVTRLLRKYVHRRDLPVEAAENTVRLLGSLATPEAFEILEEAFEREDLAYLVISVLAANRSADATRLLRRAATLASVSGTIEATVDPGRLSPDGKRTPAVARGKALDATTLTMIGERLHEGRLLVCLGPGALPDDALRPEELASRLAADLADGAGIDHSDLPRVAQQFDVEVGREALEERIAIAYRTESAPGVIERFLARYGRANFVTTNYGASLERAFAEAGRSLNVLTRLRDGRWRVERDSTTTECSINEVEGALADTPSVSALFKLCGSVSRAKSQDGDRLFVSEDDFLSLMEAEYRLPTQLSYFASSGVLFLGVPADRWHSRLIISQLGRSSRRRARSFAVNGQVTSFEWAYWERSYATVLDVAPGELLRQLDVNRAGGSQK